MKYLVVLALLLSGCVSTIGKTPEVRCQIYQSRGYWLTGAGVGAAALATGASTVTLAQQDKAWDNAMAATALGASAVAAGLAWFGSQAQSQAVAECKAK